jgi:hypothetical protein
MTCGFGESNSNQRIDDLTLPISHSRWYCYVHVNSVYSALSRKTTEIECAKRTPQNAICSGLMWIMDRSASNPMGFQLDLCTPSPRTKGFLVSYLVCCTGCAWRNSHLRSRQGYGTTTALSQMKIGLKSTEDEEALYSVSMRASGQRRRRGRTMYMKTAPKTAPATAPPSLGSSSEPITRLLLPCGAVSRCCLFDMQGA